MIFTMNLTEIKQNKIVSQIEAIGFTFGEFTSNSFTLDSKVKVTCPEGHSFIARPRNLLDERRINRASKGCPTCASIIKFEKSLKLAQSHLQPNYEIIGAYHKFLERKHLKTSLFFIIQCDKGHEYERKNGQIVYNGCSKCTETTFVGQERVRYIFELAFAKKFNKIKPNWLKNPNTSRNLELDGYCEELKIAFEYQGKQHFSNNTKFAGDYLKQNDRDFTKESQCKKLGITLLKINQPRSYAKNKFTESVIQDCIKQGIDLGEKLKNKAIDFNHINDTNTALNHYDNFKEYVLNTGNTLITQSLSTMEDEFEFQCEDGHYFKMNGLKFKGIYNKTNKMREVACRACFEIKEPHRARDIITIQSCHQFANAIGFKCLSTEYKNVNTEVSWLCNHGHTFTKTYRQMERNKTGQYCTECIKLKIDTKDLLTKLNNSQTYSLASQSINGEKRDIHWLKNFVSENNCELVGDKYLGMDTKHDFKCEQGHLFSSTISNLKDKKDRNTTFCVHCGDRDIITIHTCQEFAKKKNMQCLDSTYKNVNTPMKWICEKGHHFEKTWRQFIRNKTGKYCPHCKN